LRWLATDDELKAALPGDELVPAADLTATRGVMARAPADAVRPWIAQRPRARRVARLLVEPSELISFAMSRRMLRGIKERAERATRCPPTVTLFPSTLTGARPTADRP
jgi:hypothetical protein